MPFKKVLFQLISYREFHTEAVAIGDNHDPGTVVLHGSPHIEMGLGFVHGTFLLQLCKVTVGQILAKDQYSETNDDLSKSRDEESQAPCDERRLTVLHAGEDVRDEQVSETGTSITPTSSNSVGRAHNSGREHGRAPVLAGDEGSKGETDAKTHNDEASGTRDGSHAEGSRRSK